MTSASGGTNLEYGLALKTFTFPKPRSYRVSQDIYDFFFWARSGSGSNYTSKVLANFYYFTSTGNIFSGSAKYSSVKWGAAFWWDNAGSTAGNTGVNFPNLIRLSGDLGSASKLFSVPSRNGVPFFKTGGNNEVDCFYPSTLLTDGSIKCYYYGHEEGYTMGNNAAGPYATTRYFSPKY